MTTRETYAFVLETWFETPLFWVVVAIALVTIAWSAIEKWLR